MEEYFVIDGTIIKKVRGGNIQNIWYGNSQNGNPVRVDKNGEKLIIQTDKGQILEMYPIPGSTRVIKW